MILGALIDHGPFVEDSEETKGTEGWRDALGHLSNSSERMARVPGTVLEARVELLLRSRYLEGSYRYFICERLAITDAGRLAVARAASTIKADQRREHQATPRYGRGLRRSGRPA